MLIIFFIFFVSFLSSSLTLVQNLFLLTFLLFQSNFESTYNIARCVNH